MTPDSSRKTKVGVSVKLVDRDVTILAAFMVICVGAMFALWYFGVRKAASLSDRQWPLRNVPRSCGIH